MKQLYKISALLLLVILFAACSDDDDPMYETGTYVQSAEFTDPDAGKEYLLTEETASNTFESYTWTASDYGTPIGMRYTIQVDLKGNDFKNAVTLGSTQNRQIRFTVAEINGAILDLGVNDAEPTYLEMRILTQAYAGEEGITPLPDYPTIYSKSLELLVTPYVSDPPELYIAGAQNNWTHDVYIYSANRDSKYQGYAYLNGDFKFSSLPNWDGNNFGAGANAGELGTEENGPNLNLPEGIYWLTADTRALTWTSKAVTWGVMGNIVAGNNWATDIEMTYDTDKNVYTLTGDFVAGEYKFRRDNDWAVNLGPGNEPNILEYNTNDNIKLSSAGKYTIMLDIFSDPTKLTYTITPAN